MLQEEAGLMVWDNEALKLLREMPKTKSEEQQEELLCLKQSSP